MTTQADRHIALMDGNAALPRKNGELVFEAPWEGRVLGLAVALSDQALYAWNEFRDRLIEEISDAEARGDCSTYYERWLAAFESLVISRGLVSPDEIVARARTLAEEDDHQHDHEHHHHLG